MKLSPADPAPIPDVDEDNPRGSAETGDMDHRPTTPEGRIDRWHRKLLDLTLRNRLLNFKATKQTIPLLCPDIVALENRLAGGKKLKLVSLVTEATPLADDPRHAERATEAVEMAKAALERNEICATVTADELLKRLTTLYRASRNDLAEGGSNTLYLAVGFMRWTETQTDTRSFRAPLLLIPAQLERRNANSSYQLSHYEDEVRFNATLIQKLKRDFDCDLSELELQLPHDQHGIDVERVMDSIRDRTRSLPGFEVVDQCALASFSFAKYLMWKDLVERSRYLENNRVVRHLVRCPETAFEPAVETPIPIPETIDTQFDPVDLIHPLDADSSQLAAVMAAAQGHDFVLVGPPGTGKSQTITNMISQCLASGKTVLFVAEKTAALDVVQRRLEQNGLGDFCVELHSNKAERKRFLQQLHQAWLHGRTKRGENWKRINTDLKQTRDQLNAYVQSLHRRDINGWTAYQAMGLAVAGRDIGTPELHWPSPDQHDQHAYRELETMVGELALNHSAIENQTTLDSVTRTQWSLDWERQMIAHAETLCTEIDAFRPALQRFADALDITLDHQTDTSFEHLHALHRLAVEMVATANEDYSTVLDQELHLLPGYIAALDVDIQAFDRASSRCSATFDDQQLRQIPVDQFEQEWNHAVASYWPISLIRKRSVTRALQRFVKLGVADPQNDLPVIREMQNELARIDGNALSSRTTLWHHRSTAIASVGQHVQRCQSILELIHAAGTARQEMIDRLHRSLEPILAAGGGAGQWMDAARDFIDRFRAFDTASGRFEFSAGSRADAPGSVNCLSDSIAMARRIMAGRTGLQRWTAWQSIRQRACRVGLDPIVSALQEKQIATDQALDRFRLAYARWWLRGRIDADPVLRDFQRYRHENDIREFIELDAAARNAAPNRVRKAAAHQLPEMQSVPRKSELGMLRHQIGLKRPSRSIRELVSMMPQHFTSLAPCLLMSPLSIAQYLPADHAPFDVVIFDEASQITTWDAIGAIARGRQTIIVGDPKQLPPTNFFGNTDDDLDDDQIEDYERDLESILDEAKASGLPTLQLSWHYRSRHESLIAFSNSHYYGNQLVTFPSPQTTDSAVSLRHLPHAEYDRGKSRTNPVEAQAIVADCVTRMQRWLQLPESERKTLAVVTFNSQQQTLIQDMLDKACRDEPGLEWFFSDDRIEPTVVKNLENVQGDERDIILFSITFGADKTGNIPLTFGALNRDGGERRLNVAITRAREELVVFTSFLGEQLHAERSTSLGAKDLKSFLLFAEQGTTTRLNPAPDRGAPLAVSSLETSVADQLRRCGWDVVPQVGVSDFRIAMAVRDPHDPNRYLAAIECDGENYRNSATARDREMTRQNVLQNLGWNVLRIWSRDWWYDPHEAVKGLDQQLRSLVAPSRPAPNSLCE